MFDSKTTGKGTRPFGFSEIDGRLGASAQRLLSTQWLSMSRNEVISSRSPNVHNLHLLATFPHILFLDYAISLYIEDDPRS